MSKNTLKLSHTMTGITNILMHPNYNRNIPSQRKRTQKKRKCVFKAKDVTLETI